MSDPLTKVHRLIAREETVRAAGHSPLPKAVQQTLEYVTDHQLYRDSTVRRYLQNCSTNHHNDYFIVLKLLELVVPMSSAGFSSEAIDIYKAVVRFDTPEIWLGANRLG